MEERKTYVEQYPDLSTLNRKKRVCAYARVSGDRDEAFHSLSSQISYYQQKIGENPAWEFAGVFSDRGITGTKELRPGFQAMLTACREGKVDIVLAKSITRFARNTVILLSTIRELKSLKIEVQFEEENVSTLSGTGELILSVLAARAQEESRSASGNQLWRIQKCYQKGIPVTGNCLGYRLVDHQFLIDEEEEQLVLRIFSMYLSGMGLTAIAKQLTVDGVKTPEGADKWSMNTVRHILFNEKYQGDLKLQKRYTTDYLSKKLVANHGEKPIYYVRDAHDAIIDRETFQQVQEELERRSAQYHTEHNGEHFPFKKMICCQCGAHFIRKVDSRKDGALRPIWICPKYSVYSTAYCKSQAIPESILIQKTCEVLGLTELDEAILRAKIAKILAPEKNTLVFVFKDGSEKRVEWQHASRRQSWTPEMKEAARARAIIYWQEKKNAKITE